MTYRSELNIPILKDDLSFNQRQDEKWKQIQTEVIKEPTSPKVHWLYESDPFTWQPGSAVQSSSSSSFQTSSSGGQVRPFESIDTLMEQRRREWNDRIKQMEENFFKLKPFDFNSIGSVGLAAIGGGETHQVTFDVKDFPPETIRIKVTDDKVLEVEAKYEEKSENKSMSKEFRRQLNIPNTVDMSQLKSVISIDGLLSIEAPVAAPKYQLDTAGPSLLAVRHVPQATSPDQRPLHLMVQGNPPSPIKRLSPGPASYQQQDYTKSQSASSSNIAPPTFAKGTHLDTRERERGLPPHRMQHFDSASARRDMYNPSIESKRQFHEMVHPTFEKKTTETTYRRTAPQSQHFGNTIIAHPENSMPIYSRSSATDRGYGAHEIRQPVYQQQSINPQYNQMVQQRPPHYYEQPASSLSPGSVQSGYPGSSSGYSTLSQQSSERRDDRSSPHMMRHISGGSTGTGVSTLGQNVTRSVTSSSSSSSTTRSGNMMTGGADAMMEDMMAKMNMGFGKDMPGFGEMGFGNMGIGSTGIRTTGSFTSSTSSSSSVRTSTMGGPGQMMGAPMMPFPQMNQIGMGSQIGGIESTLPGSRKGKQSIVTGPDGKRKFRMEYEIGREFQPQDINVKTIGKRLEISAKIVKVSQSGHAESEFREQCDLPPNVDPYGVTAFLEDGKLVAEGPVTEAIGAAQVNVGHN